MHRLGFQRGKCPPMRLESDLGDACPFEIPNGAILNKEAKRHAVRKKEKKGQDSQAQKKEETSKRQTQEEK